VTKIEYSGRTSLLEHKREDWKGNPVPENANPGLKKVWFLDAQWSTCPVEVGLQVKSLWRFHELGNDNYVYKTCVNDLLELLEEKVKVEVWDETPTETKPWTGWVKKPIQLDAIIQYIREHGIPDDETVIIHWWW